MTETPIRYDKRLYAADAAIAVGVIAGALVALPIFLGGFNSQLFGILGVFYELLFFIFYALIFSFGSLTYLGSITARRARAAGWSPWLTMLSTVLIFGAGYLFLFRNLEDFNPHTLLNDFITMAAAIAPGALWLALLAFI